MEGDEDMGICKECLHFKTVCVGTTAQTDYCRKSGEVITDGAIVRECFEEGRETLENVLFNLRMGKAAPAIAGHGIY